MLTNEAKQILDYLIPAFSSGSSMIDYPSIMNATQLPFIEVKSTLQYLADNGYLKLKMYKSGGFVHSLSHKGFHYKEFEKSQSSSESLTSSGQTNIYNVNAPVSGSVIGNSGNVTISNGMSYAEVIQAINSRTDISESDKADAKKVIDYIEVVTSVDAPLPKSFLSRFSDILAKHSWLPNLIGSFLIRYFIG